MKIALVVLHADGARGGAERYTLDLAAALEKRGHEPALLASSFSQEARRFACVELPATGLTRLVKYERFLAGLDAHRAAAYYDAVHSVLPVRTCDVYQPQAGLAAEALAAGHLKYGGMKRQASALANQLNRKRRRFAAVEQRLLTGPHPPVVLCLSEAMKRQVRDFYPLADDRLALLYNAADLQRFAPAPEAGAQLRRRLDLAGRTIALMIAQDFVRKGLRQAIEALARVRRPELTLLVVGKPDPLPFRRLARELGVEAQVVFAGPTADPVPYYAAADFFVLPTVHDPCSLVVLEALAMGLPVISTTANGACELMSDGVHGVVLPDAQDVDALTQAMIRVLDPEVRRRMAEACLALRPFVSHEHHVEQLLNIYQHLRRDKTASLR